MPGPPPKDPRLRQRTNKVSTRGTVTVSGRRTAPALPKRRGGWHPRTIAWWKKVWAGDLRDRFIDVDFYPLLRLAALWDDYHAAVSPAGRLELAKELRLQEARWPFDEMARRALQVTIERPDKDAEKQAEPTEEPVDPRTLMRIVK